ncbi:MAG: reverse transcriptase domain-containing protein [Ruminococcus sp.]|nr:reverse transcriptase domain-containing protein [Ruminococcus sp.]MCM1439029.1 reverse transcriptase domain-containing protein [Roseburia sp.]
MKRDGHIIEEIIEWGNLEAAFDSVVCGTLRKSLNEGKWLIAHREEFLREVQTEIESGHLNLHGYHEKVIFEGGKQRRIQVFNMRDRIKINAVMNVVDKHLHRRFIRTTSASIKNRGMHDLKAYIENDIARHPELQFVYKCDIRKFYDTIFQDIVMTAIRHVFKDARLISILEQCVRLMPGGIGISIGMRTSQGLGNLLLSVYLDHHIKDTLGVKFYYRYCDDIVVLGATKRELWRIRDIIHERINAIGQSIKPNERVFPIEDGIDFLGYVIRPDVTRLRKRVKRHLCGQLKRVKSRKRREKIIAALFGMAKHADTRKLLKTYLTKSEMIKFADLGVTYTPADGKKRFHGKLIRIASIVNNEIEVLDFESDIKTAHGDKRYLVSIRDPRTGETCKFFTNSEEMKSALDTIREKNESIKTHNASHPENAIAELFPFATTIRSESFENGRGFRYFFT